LYPCCDRFRRETKTGDEEWLSNVYGFGHQAYYQHVIDCLVHQRAALVDGLEGRKSLELFSALYESIETGQEVPLHFSPRLCRLGVAS